MLKWRFLFPKNGGFGYRNENWVSGHMVTGRNGEWTKPKRDQKNAGSTWFNQGEIWVRTIGIGSSKIVDLILQKSSWMFFRTKIGSSPNKDGGSISGTWWYHQWWYQNNGGPRRIGSALKLDSQPTHGRFHQQICGFYWGYDEKPTWRCALYWNKILRDKSRGEAMKKRRLRWPTEMTDVSFILLGWF